MSYKGVILVGGPSVGTRFRPLSMDLPKPLFPIAGSPIIYHHLLALSKVPGMVEVLIIGFFEQTLFDRFLTEAQIEFPNIHVRYLREYQSMGTGGGIHHFKDEIMRGNPTAFFVMNGDIACSFPLSPMLYTHRQAKTLATVLSIRMDRKKLSQYGCIAVDQETKKVKHFVEKPETFVSEFISCGIYLFGPGIFSYLIKAQETRNSRDSQTSLDLGNSNMKKLSKSNSMLSARGAERVQIEQDVLPLLCQDDILSAHIMGDQDFWMSIKHGGSTIKANRQYLQHFLSAQPKRLSTPFAPSSPTKTSFSASPIRTMLSPTLESPGARMGPEIISPAFIHPTAIIHPDAKIGPNAFIGPRVLIGRGVRVADSLILDAAEISNDACILHAVVGWESKIGAWARIEGSSSAEVEGSETTHMGYKVPAAAILGKGVTVADELIIRNCIVLPHKDLKHSFQNEILM